MWHVVRLPVCLGQRIINSPLLDLMEAMKSFCMWLDFSIAAKLTLHHEPVWTQNKLYPERSSVILTMQTFPSGLAQMLLRGYEINGASISTQLAQLQKDVQTRTVKKGTILLKAGDPGNSIYFVKRGLLRTYTMDKHGKEHSFMFAPEGWFFSDFESVDISSSSIYFVDALENSEIETVHRNVLHTLKSSWQGHKHTIETLRKRVSVLEQRIIMLQSASASERYQHFQDTYPDIVQRIPQKMIATYLGITPESLSRVRKEVIG